MVSTYLVHHGFRSTAEEFAKSTGQTFDEEITSIKNRQSSNTISLASNGFVGNGTPATSHIDSPVEDTNMNEHDGEAENDVPLPHVQKGLPGITANIDDIVSAQDILLIDSAHQHNHDDMEVESVVMSGRQVCGGSRASVERMLEFGRELYLMSQHLPPDPLHKTMLEDAFSLLAYSNPWASPVGWQLDPSRREPVCAALNSAILESQKLPWRAPLEACVAHAGSLLRLMGGRGLGACAFADLGALLRH